MALSVGVMFGCVVGPGGVILCVTFGCGAVCSTHPKKINDNRTNPNIILVFIQSPNIMG